MSATEALENNHVVFDKDLIKSLNHSINYIIRTNLSSLSELGYDYDDLYQECLCLLNNSIKYYRPDRGTKFSTFAIGHIKDRLNNLKRKKMAKKRYSEEFKIVNATDSKSWPLFGIEKTDSNENFSSIYYDENDDINFKIDLNRKIQFDLNERQQHLFISYYIEGEALSKIQQDFYFYDAKTLRKDMNEIKRFCERNSLN